MLRTAAFQDSSASTPTSLFSYAFNRSFFPSQSFLMKFTAVILFSVFGSLVLGRRSCRNKHYNVDDRSAPPVLYGSTLRTTYLPGPSSSAVASRNPSYGDNPYSSSPLESPYAPSSPGHALSSGYALTPTSLIELSAQPHPTSGGPGHSSQADGPSTASHGPATSSELTGPVASSSAVPLHPSSSAFSASQSIPHETDPSATASLESLSSTLVSVAVVTSSHVVSLDACIWPIALDTDHFCRPQP